MFTFPLIIYELAPLGEIWDPNRWPLHIMYEYLFGGVSKYLADFQ